MRWMGPPSVAVSSEMGCIFLGFLRAGDEGAGDSLSLAPPRKVPYLSISVLLASGIVASGSVASGSIASGC